MDKTLEFSNSYQLAQLSQLLNVRHWHLCDLKAHGFFSFMLLYFNQHYRNIYHYTIIYNKTLIWNFQVKMLHVPFIYIFMYMWCVCVFIYVCMRMYVCVCMCVACVWAHICTCESMHLEAPWLNNPGFLFHLMHWARISQSNPEFTDIASIASQLAGMGCGNLCLHLLGLELQGRYHN